MGGYILSQVPGHADTEILKDKSYYRVANFAVDPMNDGSTSYFHNSIGGYHAAKPRRYQELFDYQIAKNNFEMLHMLNTKYIMFADEEGTTRVQLNEEANGNAWFVSQVTFVDTADEEMEALDSLNTKEIAVVHSDFKEDLAGSIFQKDSTATISMTKYKANEIAYTSKSNAEQLAVFSEMYYKNGWNAYINGQLTPHIRVNYVLRALKVPAGEHAIVFKFEPTIIKTGTTITLVSYGLLLLIPIGWFFIEKRKKQDV